MTNLAITYAKTLIIAARKLVEEPGYLKDWATPKKFLDVLYEMGPIRLDPCSNKYSLVESKERWTPTTRYLPNGKKVSKKAQETFELEWPKDGLIYVNPPYGKESDPFMEKMAQEGAAGAEIISLVPARVDTARWHQYAEQADAICFWKGRISFINPETGEPQSGTKFPSAVLYWGPRVSKFVDTFSDYGSIRLKPKSTKKKKKEKPDLTDPE